MNFLAVCGRWDDVSHLFGRQDARHHGKGANTMKEMHVSEDIYVNGKIGGGRDRQPMIHEGEYVLRPECRGEG